jgi:hypothetical protein
VTNTSPTSSTTTTSSWTSIEVAIEEPWAKVAQQLRQAHAQGRRVDGRDLALPSIRPTDPRAFVLDEHNGLVDVDARLSLAAVAVRLTRTPWRLPLFRPLSAVPLWRLAPQAPFVVDALCQRATLLTVDGDVTDTPPAPRHAAGPSVLHSAVAAAPLVLVVRAHLRLVPRARTHTWREQHSDEHATALRLRSLVDSPAAFGVCAVGSTIMVLAGEVIAPPPSALSLMTKTSTATSPQSGVRSRWLSARTLFPGDVDAMRAALRAGLRVVSIPYLQRAAVLQRTPHAMPLLDLKGATQSLLACLQAAAASTPEGDAAVMGDASRGDR